VPQGGPHYRAYVGNPTEFDLMAAYQFQYMIRFGLREHHTLLDIGCGSLRGGKLFIPYLLPGCYFGIEPNAWLVECGIDRELGLSILEVKAPTFLIDDAFTCSAFERTFDFVLAHSVFSHASTAQIRRCLSEVRQCLGPASVFAATYVPGTTSCEGTEWLYPATSTYALATIRELAQEQGLECVPREAHLYGQQWLHFNLPGAEREADATADAASASDAGTGRPELVAVHFEPATSAVVGQTVVVTVVVDPDAGDVEWIQLAVRRGVGDAPAADWVILDTHPVARGSRTSTFRWDTGEMVPGPHRVGANIGLLQGETLWWYRQPARHYWLQEP
jgi:hypothetical protein